MQGPPDEMMGNERLTRPRLRDLCQHLLCLRLSPSGQLTATTVLQVQKMRKREKKGFFSRGPLMPSLAWLLLLLAAVPADAAGAFVAPPGMVARGQAQTAAARLLPSGSERRARLACATRAPMPVCMSQDKMGEAMHASPDAGRGTYDRVSELFAGTLSDRPWGALFTALACSSTFRDKMWAKAQNSQNYSL